VKNAKNSSKNSLSFEKEKLHIIRIKMIRLGWGSKILFNLLFKGYEKNHELIEKRSTENPKEE